MAEGNEHSGKSFGGRKSYGHGGSGRPGNRGGKGFKPRGKGGYGRRDGDRDGGKGGFGGRRSYGKGGYHKDRDSHKERDFRRDCEGENRGYRKDFHRDGDNRHDGERRGGYRKGRNDFHKGGYRKDRDFHKDRDFRRDGDGENRESRHDDGYRKDRDFHKDGERRGGYRDKRGGKGGYGKGPRRDGEHGGNPRYRRDDERRDNRHNDQHGERRQFSDDEKREYREHKRTEYMSRPRRNSDGTMSFPSQNPYTARRPDEPVMPKGLEWSMLSSDERERLRGLAKEHAENIGLHILAAYALIDDDPKAAVEHAKWVARQASRIDFARETLAFAAYRTGDYKLALREFRTAFRMNGFADYLPFMADCERGLGNPKKAIELALSDDAKLLRGEAKAEMFLVYAGALGDLEQWDKAIAVVHTLARSKGLSGAYRMRALQAEQLFLEETGEKDKADALEGTIEKLEDQYADFDIDEDSDDVVIDHDLAYITNGDDEEVLDKLGIDPSEAQFAPEPEPEEDETELPAEETRDGAESDGEPAENAEAEDGKAKEADKADAETADTEADADEAKAEDPESDDAVAESGEAASDAEHTDEELTEE